MDAFQAFILGLLQGLTEFLPVSSSGHIELGKAIFGIHSDDSMIFTVVVHGATVLSTIVVFRKDIVDLFRGLFSFKWNEQTRYITMLVVSMIPAVIVGLAFEDQLKALFTGNIRFVGLMLIFTAILLGFTYYAKNTSKKVNFGRAIIIGIAQAVAILPGISRSGSTIATGLLLGVDKEKVTRFSFLMVLLPIIGANAKDLLSGDMVGQTSIAITPLIIGFITAFLSGLLACLWMLRIVKKGKLIYFAAYCLLVGIIALTYSFI